MINGLTYDEIDAIENFIKSMQDMEPEFVEIVNEHFWKLF